MSILDISIILAYFIIVITAGLWCRKMSSGSMQAYFLGNHKVPWWALAMSGAASHYSVCGTVWLISMLFVLGLKHFWMQWMAAIYMGAFLMIYLCFWIRRTNVMTGVELLKARFGEGRGASCARTTFGFMAVFLSAGTIGMAFLVIGKFAQVYGLNPILTGTIVTILTGAYVLVGGFRGVILTDVIQTVLLIVISAVIGVIAYQHCGNGELDSIIPNVAEYKSMNLPWNLDLGRFNDSAEFGGYQQFGKLFLTYLVLGMLISLSGGGGHYAEQRFLATKNQADAAKVAALWAALAVPRWLLTAAFVFLGYLAFADIEDPNQLIPMVIDKYLGPGIKGLVITGLVAAFMSTISSLINSAAAILVRDIWQPLFRKNADERTLMKSSHIASVLMVIFSLLIGITAFQFSSVNGIWTWLMAGLGGSMFGPLALRWYWWRQNGWGFSAGCLAGFLVSILMLVKAPIPSYWITVMIMTASVGTSIIVSYLTAPVELETLKDFYQKVRPFGAWGGLCNRVTFETEIKKNSVALTAFNVLIAIVAHYTLYCLPIYWVAHWYTGVWICVVGTIICFAILYKTWYKRLPTD